MERDMPVLSFQWKLVAELVMQLYPESTDGSYLEYKESALVWHRRFPDPDFGSWQAKKLQNPLESVLANELVAVKSGVQIVEVTPQLGKNQARLSITWMIQLRSSRCCKAWHQPLTH